MFGTLLFGDGLFADPDFPLVGDVWVPQNPNIATWSEQAKSSDSWVAQAKSIDTWVEQTKRAGFP